MEDALVAVGSAGWAEPNCGHGDGSLAVPVESERSRHDRRKRPREENGDYNYYEHGEEQRYSFMSCSEVNVGSRSLMDSSFNQWKSPMRI